MKIIAFMNYKQLPTHDIANKGFASQNSLRSVQSYAKVRSPLQFLCNWIGNHPQSLTALILERYLTTPIFSSSAARVRR